MAQHCFHIFDETMTPRGCAFLATSKHAVTAAHCLTGVAEVNQTIDLAHTESFELQSGVVQEVRDDNDLALISLDVPAACAVPPSGPCSAGKSWSTEYRPGHGEAYIRGSVTHSSISYELSSGAKIVALQLAEEGNIGSYEGYSGSPVEVDRGGGKYRVVGVLLEEHLDRSDPAQNARASGVLVAAKIEDVYNFKTFADVIHKILVIESGYGASATETLQVQHQATKRASATLKRLRELSQSGDITASTFERSRARVTAALAESLEVSSSEIRQ